MHELLLPFAHEELFDQLRPVGQAERLGMAHETVGKKVIRCGRDAAVAASQQEVLGRADKIGRPNDLMRRLVARPFHFGRIIEQHDDGAVAFEER